MQTKEILLGREFSLKPCSSFEISLGAKDDYNCGQSTSTFYASRSLRALIVCEGYIKKKV